MPHNHAIRSALPPVAIVVSRYNVTVTDRLLAGAAVAYQRAGGRLADLHIAEAPGAFELVPICAAAARQAGFAGVVALGCIIRGETRHDEVLGDAVTSGLANIALITGVPIGLGVLTVNSAAQAAARAGGKLGNKGEEAMVAVLATIGEIAILSDPKQLKRAASEGLTSRRLMASGLSVLPDKAAHAGGRARSTRRAGTRGAG